MSSALPTVIFLGSSVTVGDHGYSMVEYTAQTLPVRAVKWAVSGTTLADISPTSYVARLDLSLPSEPRCDLFVCQLSTNDAKKKLPLGEISESTDRTAFDTKTIIGAIEYIIATAKETYGCPIAFYTGTRYANGHYAAMVEALGGIKEKWGITVVDLWNDEEMSPCIKEIPSPFMKDPIHPTALGYREWWGPRIVSVLQQLL